MNGNTPLSWTSHVTKALTVLVIAAVVLTIVERVFLQALPGLLVILILIGIVRLAVGINRNRDGW